MLVFPGESGWTSGSVGEPLVWCVVLGRGSNKNTEFLVLSINESCPAGLRMKDRLTFQGSKSPSVSAEQHWANRCPQNVVGFQLPSALASITTGAQQLPEPNHWSPTTSRVPHVPHSCSREWWFIHQLQPALNCQILWQLLRR